MSSLEPRISVGTHPGTPGPEPDPAEPVPPSSGAAPQPQRSDIDGLADIVAELGGRPIDVWGVAALLESAGVRDLDAVQRHRLPDVFALARQVYDRLKARHWVPPPPQSPTLVDDEQHEQELTLGRSARLWARGGFFFVPMGLQVLSLVVIGYSQYASVHFTTEQASVVAIAIGMSFVVTGGFVQGLGYLGPVFEAPGKHMLTQRVVYAVLLIGLAGTALIGAIGYGVNALVDAYPSAQAQILVVYFILAAAQALVNAALYMLKRYLAMGLSTIAALGVVAALTQSTSISITHVHWIALGTWSLLELAWLALVLRHRAGETVGSMRMAALPRTAFLVRRALPYSAYGSLYFVFLLTDRLVAWSAGSHPLPFWFRTPYELGLDAALVAAVLAIAFLEVTVDHFTRLLLPTGDSFSIVDRLAHNRSLTNFWRRQLLFVVGLLAVGGALAVGFVELARALNALGSLKARLHDSATLWAFAGGFVGYGLLAVGLANSVFLFTLSRPGGVIRAAGAAAIASAGVGLAVTSFEPYYTAVLGLVAGSLMFAIITGLAARRTLRSGDYWLYAAW
jgi:hypothetical protein